MSNLEFHQFPCLEDNYGVLVHDPESGLTATIDAPDADAIEAVLKAKGWTLTHIFVTHHHWDHTQGIAQLKSAYDCRVLGPAVSEGKIQMMDEMLSEGDSFPFGCDMVAIIATPGHTVDMINFHFREAGVVFTGDTLFALGCGRIFEGDPAMMWRSLSKLADLPEETIVYCGHEYTLANAKFALTVDPGNDALQKRSEEITSLRAQNKPTLPTTIGLELATNPFLRANNAEIRAHLDMEDASDAEVFAEIRKRKDNA